MSGPRFTVTRPVYETKEGETYEVPKLRELCLRMSRVLQLFVDPELQVHQLWYSMLPSGDADLKICKERFRQLAKEFPTLFPIMYQTTRAEGSDLHTALTDIGAIHYYGGWKRRFDESAMLRGPLWTCSSVSFRSACKVLGPTLVDSRVTIGTSAIVNRSIIGSNSEIDSGAQVADSVIGRNVYVGPNVLLLHKPLSGKLDPLKEGIRLTNRPKCGVVVGDRCRIGAGARIEPGSVLLPGCVVPIDMHLPTGIYCPEDFR